MGASNLLSQGHYSPCGVFSPVWLTSGLVEDMTSKALPSLRSGRLVGSRSNERNPHGAPKYKR